MVSVRGSHRCAALSESTWSGETASATTRDGVSLVLPIRRSLEFSVAWRYLRGRRKSRLLSLISVIAIGGIAVAVAALILIIGVMNGLQTDLREKILVGSPDIRVLTFGEDLAMAGWATAIDTVRRVKGVVAVSPFVHTQAIATKGSTYHEGVFVMGLLPARRGTPTVTSLRETAKHGDFGFGTGSARQDGLVLGSRLAARLNVVAGIDSVTLLAAGGVSAVTGTLVPSVRRYEVTGVFETGLYEYDNSYVIMELGHAQELAQMGTAVTGLEVRTRTRDEAPRVASAITDALGFPYRTEDWAQQNSSLFQALKLEKVGMSAILLLIVLVAAFNVVSTLTMVVADKTREIGILKTMGMSARSVRLIFMVQGIMIGLVGTIVGFAVGLMGSVVVDRYRLIGLDPSVYFIDHLPVESRLLDVAAIVIASLLVSALATVYPASQAARLYPIEAIRRD
jgi:lipoprotein-releasing system permease protein